MRIITFASRWKKELQPEIVKAGRDLAKQLKRDKNIVDDVEWIAAHNRNSDKRSELTDKTLRTRYKKGKVITRIFQDPLSETTTSKNRLTKSNGKVGISDIGRSKLEQLGGKQNPTIPSNKFLGNAKKFIGKNKKSLVGAGIVTLGAIGYKVARKIRSDKNKKRGRYFK